MFGLGKKPTPKSKAALRLRQQQRGPLRYLGMMQTVQVARNGLDDVRGLEWVAYPVIALVAWRTLRAERRRRVKLAAQAQELKLAARRDAIRDALPADLRGRKKRFILF
jgi:hypothetical protein